MGVSIGLTLLFNIPVGDIFRPTKITEVCEKYPLIHKWTHNLDE